MVCNVHAAGPDEEAQNQSGTDELVAAPRGSAVLTRRATHEIVCRRRRCGRKGGLQRLRRGGTQLWDVSRTSGRGARWQ